MTFKLTLDTIFKSFCPYGGMVLDPTENYPYLVTLIVYLV